MKTTKKINNRGFSIVELMVVVGIISVLVGGFTFGYSLISQKNVEQCTKKIQAQLDSCRATSMGKLNVSLKIYTSGDKILLDKTVGTSTTVHEIGTDELVVEYTMNKNGVTYTQGITAAPIEVSFNRVTGSINPNAGGYYLNKIRVTNTSGTRVFVLNIDKLTGRVSID